MIAPAVALAGRGRISGIALQPVFDYIVIKLLGPQHAGKALAHHVLRVRRKILRNHRGIKLICLALALGKGVVEAGKSVCTGKVDVGQSQSDDYRLPGRDRELSNEPPPLCR